MYCFEAKKCNNLNCPARYQSNPRCWLFFAGKSETNHSIECKKEDCATCNYRLGWEIGLISDSLFEKREIPTADEIIPIEKRIEDKTTSSKTPDASEKRFCYEINNCNNTKCPVREQQIFRCFKFFEPRSANEKCKITKCNRSCENCFYKNGWDIGILNENKFSDIIEKKKIKLRDINTRQNNLIVEIYMAELAKKPLSQEEEYELAKRIAGDKKASELFLMANLKLVTRIAKKYSDKMPLMDLIQEGNVGLIKAIAKFDYKLGYKFSTYAAYWIKYYMQRAVSEQASSITLPCHLLAVANKIKKTIQNFEEQLQRAPNITELSQILGIPEDKIVNILNITQTPISIYTKVSKSEDENETLEYYIEDKKTLTPEEALLEKEKNEAIQKGLQTLNERQRGVIENFYGINCDERSLADLGREMGISRERVRQILQQALSKLQQCESIISIH